jgi:ABC-2 type transport system ATP-binding protein
VEIRTGGDNPAETLEKIAGVKSVAANQEDGWHRCVIRVEANSDLREDVFRLAVERRWTIRELTQDRPTLEDVFVELTHTDN